MEFENEIENETKPTDESPGGEQDYKKLYEEEKARTEKISSDYKEKEKLVNQHESLIKNLGSALEEKGVGKMIMAGDRVRIELNEQKQREQEKSEMDILKEQEANLKIQKDNDEISDDMYNEKRAGIIAELKYIERRTKEESQNQLKQKELETTKYRQDWINRIDTEFKGDANNTNSDLFKEMNAIATKGVDYHKDPALYYELAKRAQDRITARAGGSEMNAADEYGNLRSSSVGTRTTQPGSDAEILSKSDKSFIDAQLPGKESAKRIEKILNANKRMGAVREDDPNFVNSTIYLPS